MDMVTRQSKTALYVRKALKIILDVLLLMIFFIPFYWMLLTAIKTLDQVMAFPPTFWVSNPQWQNFITALESMDFFHYLKNSIIITCGVLVMQVVTMVPAAYAFAKYEFAGKNIAFGVVLASTMIPVQLVFLPIFLILSNLGLINTYWGVILPQATSAMGIFMLRQNFMQVSTELIEAARLDNAGEIKIMFRIMLPMAKGTLAALMLMNFISVWNDYFWVKVLTTNSNVRTLPVGVAELSVVEGGGYQNVIMAANILMMLPIFIAFLLAQKQIMKAFSYSGVK